MKKKICMAVIYAGLTLGFLTAYRPAANAQVSVSFQVFYDNLSPYGTWIDYPDYGYVWLPTEVPHGFRPYATGGRWVYTDEGWAWVSEYDWGWAPFHYGNWFYDPNYGWMWLPDYEWAPAWVTWGDYSGSYCWAPIGPRVSFGLEYRPPIYCWTFCPHDRITSVNMSNYYISHVNNTTIVNHITVINNVNTVGGRSFVRGPQPQNVERFTHTTIRPVSIQASASPGRGRVANGQLAVYRPTVSRSGAISRPSPAHVADYHNLHPSALPGFNSRINQQTFTSSHTSSPIRGSASTTPSRPSASPAASSPARVDANSNPAGRRPSNPPSSGEARSNPATRNPNPSASRTPASRQQVTPHNNPVAPSRNENQPRQPQQARRPAQQQRQPVQQRQPAQQQRQPAPPPRQVPQRRPPPQKPPNPPERDQRDHH